MGKVNLLPALLPLLASIARFVISYLYSLVLTTTHFTHSSISMCMLPFLPLPR
ncbi:hypothetical protein Fmac_030025 [Flemingia macrophylla]|uniref:Uncharacterized protein n=1 Tax=Flemingia macrophylla TaxID=520843 RepID=A0ABD1LC04_9FABA